MPREDGGRWKVSRHVGAGRSFFFFYVTAAITVATDGSDDDNDDEDNDVADEDVGAMRRYFGGESFTRVTEENYKKKKAR